MSVLQWALVLTAVGVGALVQGSIGFGMNLVAAPVAAIVDPHLVPVPLLVAALTLATLMTWRERGHLELGELSWAVVGRLPGDVFGALAVVVLARSSISLFLAVAVLCGVLLSLAGLTLSVTRRSLLCVGTVSGFMGTATSVGGPPIALLYQHDGGPRVRAMLSCFLLIGSALSLTFLAAAGQTDVGHVRDGLVMVPAVAAGFALSTRTRHLADRGHTRRLVLAVSALAALGLAARALL